MHHYSRFIDKGPSIDERVIGTVRNLLKKGFEKGKIDWLSELSAVVSKYNNTIHSSTKMSPSQASKKVKEKLVFSNLKDNIDVQKPKLKLGHIVRTADIKRVFSKADSTNISYKLYTITEVFHDSIPSYRINYLPERYNQNFLLPTKLSLEQNNQVMKKSKFN